MALLLSTGGFIQVASAIPSIHVGAEEVEGLNRSAGVAIFRSDRQFATKEAQWPLEKAEFCSQLVREPLVDEEAQGLRQIGVKKTEKFP